MSFSNSQLEQIKANLDIVQLVSEVVPLQKKGKSYFGVCPFHQEKSPSFSVSSERQLFHCFGCKVGGDLIKFVQLYYRYDFPQAVEELAKKAGIALEATERWGDWEESLKLLELAAAFYERQLHSEGGAAFRAYLKSRQVPLEIAKKFRLGAHLGGHKDLVRELEAHKLSKDIAVRLGLIGRSSRGEFVDRFRGRLLFSIADDRGKIRGFGARGLGNEQPKYINSPASPVFDKKKLLYGMNLASQGFRLKDFAILVEGYMDVIALHREGIENVVGIMGTALTQDQVRKLKRWTHRFLSLFDGDEAGLLASERNMELFIKEAITAKVLVLPGSKDPDSFFQDAGEDRDARKKAWREALTGARSCLDFLVEQRVLAEKDSVQRAKRLRELVDLLDRSPDPLQRVALKRDIQKRFEIPWEMLEKESDHSSSSEAPQAAYQPHVRAGEGREPSIYADLLKFLVQWGNDREFDLGEVLPFIHPLGLWSELLGSLIRSGQSGSDIARLEWMAEAPEEIQIGVRESLLQKLEMSDSESQDLAWTQMTKRLKSEYFKRESARLQQALVQAEAKNDDGGVQQVLKEKQDLIQLIESPH